MRFDITAANRHLADLLGWTNIVDVGGGALLGKPTWGCPNSRDQAQIPNWAGDWKDCGPLLAEYLEMFQCIPVDGSLELSAPIPEDLSAFLRDLILMSDRTREVIVRAFIAKLEAAQ